MWCRIQQRAVSVQPPYLDEKTGMVLSEERREKGEDCKDSECTKSDVSPTAVLVEQIGPSRLLCEYQNCNNPSCPSGTRTRMETLSLHQLLPPPKTPRTRLNRLGVGDQDFRVGSDNEDGDGDVEVVMRSKNLLDGASDD
jgi:hypothetical protein